MVEVMMMWQSLAAWFTPTVLFCVTNCIIATIFIASNKHQHHQHPHADSNSPSLTSIARVSSFLDRARSIKLSSSSSSYTTTESQHQYDHPPAPPVQPIKTATYSSTSRLAQSIFTSSARVTPPELPNSVSRVDSVIESGKLDRVPSFFDRVKSFKISSAFKAEAEKNSTSEMKKSHSEVRIVADDEDDVDIRRPETARESRNDHADEEVDAKADDFISRFKQQLKLQRLESLVRYNEMLNRRR